MTFPISLANLVDVVIAITVMELGVLLLHRRLTGRGIAPRDYLANMVSGLCLMSALRCVVIDTGAVWVVAWLLAAGVAHGVDILSRLRRSERATAIPHGVTA